MPTLPDPKWSEDELKDFGKLHGLSPREQQVLFLLTTSVVTFKDMAERLGLSPNTVHNHFRNIFDKTNARSKADLLAKVLKHMVAKYNSFKALVRVPQVVVVDDEPLICEILTRHLENKGMKVYSFCNSNKVLPFLRNFRPDIVLSDIRMPELDGYALLKEIRSQYGASPAVMLMSGNSPDHSAEDAIKLGALNLINKPFDLEALSSSIMDHFIQDVNEKNRYLRISHEIPIRLNDSIDASIENIGYGGIFVRIDSRNQTALTAFASGAILTFDFNLDDDEIHGKCQIVWKNSAGLGMKFTTITTVEREKILQYIQLKKALSFIPHGVNSENETKPAN
ncbi:MAG: response regulator [Methylotenera sp.]|nr:response regulator [Oligoflexia bacterium]